MRHVHAVTQPIASKEKTTLNYRVNEIARGLSDRMTSKCYVYFICENYTITLYVYFFILYYNWMDTGA